jgi:hypothetical protein
MACTPLLVQASPGVHSALESHFRSVCPHGAGQTNPRYQTGLCYSPTKDIDWDLIYGRNLLGEGSNWITVGLTVRIGDN